jgi:hypothetical protein
MRRTIVRGVLPLLLLILATLALAAKARSAEPRMVLDWTNRIAREIGATDGYTPAQWDELVASRDVGWWCFAGRALFTDRGGENARALRDATGAKILGHVSVLHSSHPTRCEEDAGVWPLMDLECETVPEILRNEAGELSVRWYVGWSDRFEDQRFHSDPRQDPEPYARGIVEFARAAQVDGLFLDYLAELPWTYPEDAPLILADGGLLWRSYQVRLLWHLRQLAPDLLLVGNGKWAMDEPLFGPRAAQLLDGVFWERCGTLWWTPEQVLERWRARRDDGMLQFYDFEKRGPKAGVWDLRQLGEAAAILYDQRLADRLWE